MIEAPATRIDRLLDGRLALRQRAKGHRAGTDAVLLAAAAGLPAGLLVDVGAGVGTAGLMAALREPGITVQLVERDAEAVALARDNIAANGLSDRVTALTCDITSASSRREAGLAEQSAACVIANPPWYATGSVRVSPVSARASAHVLGAAGDLDAWLRGMSAITAPGGHLVLIHRADALPALFEACAGRFGDLTILPIHPRAEAEAIRVLVGGKRGGRGPLRLLPPLILHEADGRFTPLAEALHRGTASLNLTRGEETPVTSPRPTDLSSPTIDQ